MVLCLVMVLVSSRIVIHWFDHSFVHTICPFLFIVCSVSYSFGMLMVLVDIPKYNLSCEDMQLFLWHLGFKGRCQYSIGSVRFWGTSRLGLQYGCSPTPVFSVRVDELAWGGNFGDNNPPHN